MSRCLDAIDSAVARGTAGRLAWATGAPFVEPPVSISWNGGTSWRGATAGSVGPALPPGESKRPGSSLGDLRIFLGGALTAILGFLVGVLRFGGIWVHGSKLKIGVQSVVTERKFVSIDANHRRALAARGNRLRTSATIVAERLGDAQIEHLRSIWPPEAELLKIRVAAPDKPTCVAVGEALADRVPCQVVQVVGRVLLLYRAPDGSTP